MPHKPNPRGVEVWAVCESGTGYILTGTIHTKMEHMLDFCERCRDMQEMDHDLGFIDVQVSHPLPS